MTNEQMPEDPFAYNPLFDISESLMLAMSTGVMDYFDLYGNLSFEHMTQYTKQFVDHTLHENDEEDIATDHLMAVAMMQGFCIGMAFERLYPAKNS